MTLKSNLADYRSLGLTAIKNVISNSLVEDTRQEILNVIEEISGQKIDNKRDLKTFQTTGTAIIWNLVNSDPSLRNVIYKYVQRIPSLFGFANHEVLRSFSNEMGVKLPSVRELKVQLYLPWEKCFFQPAHQDINSLDSTESVTFWIPLQPVTPDYAVRYWVGSHVEGPVEHEEIRDENFGVYHCKVPDKYLTRYRVIPATAEEGDVIALNRVLFHSSPDFEKSLTIRATVLVRYDELHENAMVTEGSRFQHLTPYNPKRYNDEILPRLRSFLAKKPVIDWKEKLKHAQI